MIQVSTLPIDYAISRTIAPVGKEREMLATFNGPTFSRVHKCDGGGCKLCRNGAPK